MVYLEENKMPTYLHLCSSCNYEWEDNYSIHSDIPTVCPHCNIEGKVKRLIAGKISGIISGGKDIPTRNELLHSDVAVAKFVGDEQYNTQVKPREQFKKDHSH